MSRQHDSNTQGLSRKAQITDVATSKRASRHTLLYGLVAVAVGAVGIYGAPPSLAQPADPHHASSPTPQSAAGSALAAEMPFYNLGTVSMAAGKVTRSYTIGNVGKEPLTITQLSTSCMCTEATLITASGRRGPFGMPGHAPIPKISERLAPGELAEVEVVFDPAAHGPAGLGRINRNVTIENDAGAPLQLAFTAMVKP
ncbi:MAG TPA: DUF1573 domain-containing protein [Casimicrobiaceae bacterium]